MNPVPQALDTQPPLDGRLGDPSILPRLFAWLARGEWSGMVVVRAGDVERRVYLVEGRVGTAGSTDPGESLAQSLIREGLMTEEDRSRAAGQLRVTDRGWSFGRQLVRSGMLQERDLARVERRRVIQLVEATLALRTGTYACEPGTVAGDAQPQQALEVPRLVAEGVLTHWDANSALEALGGRDALLSLVVEHLPEHEATGAEEAYDYTLLLCNGRRSVEEVLALSPLPEAASLRFLASLRLLDIIATQPARRPAPAPEPEPQAPAVAPVAAGAVAEPSATPAVAASAAEPAPPRAEAPAAVGESPRPAAAPAPPVAASPRASAPRPQRKPAAAAAAAASSGASRHAWVAAIIVVLLAATAFFAWVGWRQVAAPEPAGSELVLPPMEVVPPPPVTAPSPSAPLPEAPGALPAGALPAGAAPASSAPAAVPPPTAPAEPQP